MFCTNTKAEQRAKKMGLTTVYDPQLFGAIPTEEVQNYGDDTFGAVVYAKVVVAHLASVVGYNFLFEDLDINPVAFFLQQQGFVEKFDLLFQDDQARTRNYSESRFSTTTGFGLPTKEGRSVVRRYQMQ